MSSEAINLSEGLQREKPSGKEALRAMIAFDSLHPITQSSIELTTEVYSRSGLIDETDLTDGRYIDEYTSRSVHFYEQIGNFDVSARLITGKIDSLPTLNKFAVDPDMVRNISGVDKLADLDGKDVVEVSGLAALPRGGREKDPSGLKPHKLFYTKLLRHSMEQGHKLWVLNTDNRIIDNLAELLGEDQVKAIGDEQEYMGPPTKPVAINPTETVASILNGTDEANLQYIKHVFDGVDADRISPTMRKMLVDSGIDISLSPLMKRLSKQPATWAYTGIMGYSLARPLLAGGVDQFDGDVATFIAIDIGTAIPYTWSVVETFSGSKTPLARKVGAIAAKTISTPIAVGTFAAPYVYFYANAKGEYPGYVNAIVAGMIAVPAVGQVLRHRKEKKLDSLLSATTLTKSISTIE